MLLAQKLHSIEELEKNRIAFYKRFEEGSKMRKISKHKNPFNHRVYVTRVFWLTIADRIPMLLMYNGKSETRISREHATRLLRNWRIK